MEEETNYTAADIQRYVNGEMSAAEMHALEKAALDDPFLGDALEGYAAGKKPASENITQDLDDLKDRLESRLKQTGTIIPVKRFQGLKIAAMIILLAGVGTFIYTLVNPPALNKSVVVNERNVQKEYAADSVQAASPGATDSVSIVMNEPVNAKPPNAAAPGSLRPHPERSLDASIPANRDSRERDKAEESNAVSSKTKRATDATVESKDQVLARSSADIVTKPNPVDSELSLISSAKKSVEASPSITFKSTTAEPAIGWKDYNIYIEKNKGGLQTDKLHGVTEISFSVNDDGKLGDFNVLKTTSADAASNTISLIKQGPGWRTVKVKRGHATVIINY